MKDHTPADIRNFAVVGHASAGKTLLAEETDPEMRAMAQRREVTRIGIDGFNEILTASGGKVRLELKGDKKMAPGALIRMILLQVTPGRKPRERR